MGLKIDRRAQKILKYTGIALGVIVAGCLIKVFFWEQAYYRNKSAETRNPEQAVIANLAEAEAPSEVPVTNDDLNKYQVDASAPRFLEIPRLEVKARVKKQSITNHTMLMPENIYDVSWYAGSGRPGEKSNILISGVAKGLTNPGVFANLDSLEENDEIILETGRGDKYTYKVAEILIIDKNDIKDKISLAQKKIDGKETLALITGRRANEVENELNSIVVVRATIK